MKNLIFISTLLAAGTLAAKAAITLDYASVGNFNRVLWYGDNEIGLYSSTLNQYSGFYTFKTSKLDFSNIELATFNIFFTALNDVNLKVWAVERENTDLSEDIAKDIIEKVNQESGFVSTPLTSKQSETMLSIDITSILQKITKGKDVAILIGADDKCDLDCGAGGSTTLSVEFSAVPEPSMFGLLAGTLALALAGTRRRRRK